MTQVTDHHKRRGQLWLPLAGGGAVGAIGLGVYVICGQLESLARAESLASVTVMGRPAVCSPMTGTFW